MTVANLLMPVAGLIKVKQRRRKIRQLVRKQILFAQFEDKKSPFP